LEIFLCEVTVAAHQVSSTIKKIKKKLEKEWEVSRQGFIIGDCAHHPVHGGVLARGEWGL
jgi:hypothetical protein